MRISAAKSNKKERLHEGDEITVADLRESGTFKRFKGRVLLHIEKRTYATYRTLNEAFPGRHYEINLALAELESSGFIRKDESNVLTTKFYPGGVAIEPLERVTKKQFISETVTKNV